MADQPHEFSEAEVKLNVDIGLMLQASGLELALCLNVLINVLIQAYAQADPLLRVAVFESLAEACSLMAMTPPAEPIGPLH